MDLHLENLTKRFGNRVAVEIPSLTIAQGEFFTLVGPSGCGKSTTLNLIAGLEEASSGVIRLDGRDLTGLPPHRRDIAFVFQSYALYPHRTVFGNMAFPLELAGKASEEIRERVNKAAQMLDLVRLLDKRPAQLSGGERQRVALGRAIVRQPQLFLFDEPLSNLDAPLRAQMRRELRRLHAQLQTTFIYVTHDQEEALSLSDRIAVMKAGSVEQCGTPNEIYERPANVFVAAFFGTPTINLLEATVQVDDGARWIRVGEHRLPAAGAATTVPEGKVTLGVRPEHVRVSRESRANAWPAKVGLVEPHGAVAYLDLELAGLRITAVERVELGFRTGEQVWLHIEPERMHYFDPASGARLEG
jgi:multiple sugar transport system ATP-binding protein